MVFKHFKIILLQALLVFCACNQPQSKSDEDNSLQTYVIEELNILFGDKNLYTRPFSWDTLKMPEIACTAYKLKYTKPAKFAMVEVEKITIIVDPTNHKYVLRTRFAENLFSEGWVTNIADLTEFINDQDSNKRIKRLSDIINFHRSSYSPSSAYMSNKIDSVKIKQFEQAVLIKNSVSSPSFCSNAFKDRLHHFFKQDNAFFEVFISAYFYDDIIISFGIWKNGKNGYYRLQSKIFDANNYFAKPEYQYRCPH